MLDNDKMLHANKLGDGGNYGFNCWGATLYVLGQRQRLTWIYDEEITTFLNENTFVLGEDDEPETGDILALWWGSDIEHTAVYIGDGLYFHKRGMNTSEVTDYDGIFATYSASKIEHRRINYGQEGEY